MKEKEIKEQIIAVQKEWATGIVAIGKDLHPVSKANEMLDKLYHFGNKEYGKPEILFKPTLATQQPIRTNREETLSYFIGGEFDATGFALKPWNHVIFNVHDMKFTQDGREVLVMGTYVFYPTCGNPVAVDYTFGYRDIGTADLPNLRIFLHHSSLAV